MALPRTDKLGAQEVPRGPKGIVVNMVSLESRLLISLETTISLETDEPVSF